jgi:hypothetical protein
MAGFEVIIYGRFWVITEATGPNGCLAPPSGSLPASMVGSISLASEVSLLLLVPTFPAKTQIKCAKEIVRYPPTKAEE